MLVIYILISLVAGFCLCFRFLDDLKTKNLLSREAMTKIGTGYFLWNLAGFFFISTHSLLMTAWIFLPVVGCLFLEILVRRLRERQFRREFVTFLSSLILQMKAGKSFREALRICNRQTSTFFQQKMDVIMEIVVFSQHQKSPHHGEFVEKVIQEFVLVDRCAHAAVKKLDGFRRKLEIEDDFRRKSGQILLQLRIQALIMTGLFIALLGFVVFNYGFKELEGLMTLSAALFGCGLILSFVLGRKIKWNI